MRRNSQVSKRNSFWQTSPEFNEESGKNESPLMRTCNNQIRALTHGFCNNNLPWEGECCRSIMAGGSGILYFLPALVCPSNFEKMMWVLQAFFSVWADYFHIHHRSVAHGIDRWFATAMTARMIYLAATRLQPWTAMTALGPISCFAGAGGAKKKMNLEAWHQWHLTWHITGSLLSLGTMHMIYFCEGQVEGSSFLPASAYCL